jgi:EAL domain-containing protein (putative c-di-GMP-specific phosphodiesterase class I)
MGGCGTGLCLILAILITGRQINQRRLSQISLFPILFNINELMVFGIPIVLNPAFMIPFICVPLILTFTSYWAISNGLVPHTTNLVEWTTPIFLSGYISTGSISGSVMQLFNLAIGTLSYMPFVKLSERVLDIQLKNSLAKVYEEQNKAEIFQPVPQLLERHDDVGRISKSLTAKLEFDLQKNNIELFYQPISDYDGNVIFIEALLRWNHSSYGYINPSLVIGLAEEAKLMSRLGYQILNKSCTDLKTMNEAGIDVILSVNVSASQLEEDGFVESVDRIIHKHGIDPKHLQIEITEGIALSNSEKILSQIKAIRNLGVGLAMDDFGMGHSSLRYLKEYDFDTIKLDGSLTREIVSNQNCRDIVSSIISLGKSLKYTVIAEYVDNPEQMVILNDLDCGLYQGHLFSPALPYDETIKYILSKN